MKKIKYSFIPFALAVTMIVLLQSCTTKTKVETVDVQDPKISDLIVPQSEVPLPSNFVMDTSFTHDKAHCNVGWQSKFFDFSDTYLTGRFADFGFKPKFEFYQNDLSKCKLSFWVRVSTALTGESGRDGYGKCGPNYYGVVYTDSNKTAVDPKCDTAWYVATSFSPQGNGYLVKGNLTFNRYLPASGQADGTPITKPCNLYLTYNGSYDFDGNNDGTPDKLRVGFSCKFTFNRSDFMDKNSTKVYFPYPKVSEKAASDAAFAANKTYGVWSTSIADEMIITVNHVYYKNH